MFTVCADAAVDVSSSARTVRGPLSELKHVLASREPGVWRVKAPGWFEGVAARAQHDPDQPAIRKK
jgi:hypothetical protein